MSISSRVPGLRDNLGNCIVVELARYRTTNHFSNKFSTLKIPLGIYQSVIDNVGVFGHGQNDTKI